MAQLRIIVADDNPESLQTLSSFLRAEFEIVAAATDSKSVLVLVRRWKPDVVVMALNLPDDAMEVVRALAKDPQGPAVVICSVDTRSDAVEAALQAGAAAYVSKAQMGEGLALAVHSAHHGRFLPSAKGKVGGPPDRAKFFKELGLRIRGLRQKAGYTQAQMSTFGFSTRHWQQIEAGRPISVTTLLRICWLFKINMDELLRGLEQDPDRDKSV